MRASIAGEQDRSIKMASAFPVSPTVSNKRGINSTDWIPIDRGLYDNCLDSRDYRPNRAQKSSKPRAVLPFGNQQIRSFEGTAFRTFSVLATRPRPIPNISD